MNRKIQILCLVAVFTAGFSFKVQAQQVGSVWVNALAGGNNTWILNQNAYGNQEIEYAPAFGFTGGVGMSYFHNRNWGFNGSFLASQLGQNYAGYQGGAEATRKIKLTYLEVPLLIMRNIPEMLYPTWISFGPDIMLLLDAKQDYSRDGGSPLPNPDAMLSSEAKERFNTVDVAVNLSLNRMYTLDYFQKLMFLISVNSTVGLTDINKSSWQIPNTHSYYGKSHNFYIGVKVGIMYKVGRLGYNSW
jgi:hypothetical protein